MSTQEGGPASAAPPPREVIDTTQDGCAGPAAAGMDGSSSSAGSSRGSGSSGTSGGSDSSHGLMPASASPSVPPAASLAVRRGALRSWTVGKGSRQALDVFCQANPGACHLLPKRQEPAQLLHPHRGLLASIWSASCGSIWSASCGFFSHHQRLWSACSPW